MLLRTKLTAVQSKEVFYLKLQHIPLSAYPTRENVLNVKHVTLSSIVRLIQLFMEPVEGWDYTLMEKEAEKLATNDLKLRLLHHFLPNIKKEFI